MHNIAHLLSDEARRQPRAKAVIFPESRDPRGRVAYTHLTFADLDRRSDFLAWGLHRLGARPGWKALLMIRPSLDFYAALFALFKIGAVPVLIDPGMGWPDFLRSVDQVKPEIFLGIPAAHLLKICRRRYFRSVRISLTLGRRLFWGGHTLDELPGQEEPYPLHEPEADEPAAILFTSGSTGPAKGVTYTHRIFQTQVEVVRRDYGLGPGDMDLACFPLFSLFSVALGACALIPDLDATRPAQVDPERIIEACRQQPVTYSFGSPAIWERVSAYCVEHGVRLPGLKRIIMAGAPVRPEIHARLLQQILDPGAETLTPYGATEALPVSGFSGSQTLRETAPLSAEGRGTCVGNPIPEVTARIIRIDDQPIAVWSPDLELPPGSIGELCVRGPCVTREYYGRPEATALAKISDGDTFWHRMGDVGYFDAAGRFWFCGRKAHRVVIRQADKTEKTLFSIQVEAIFNRLSGVRRSALIGLGERPAQTPAIVIEPADWNRPPERAAILAAAAAHPLTADIRTVFLHRSFPVDVRHNAKINREALAAWAATAPR